MYTQNSIITNAHTQGYSTLAGAGAGAGACSELALVPLEAAGGCGPLRRPFSLENMSPKPTGASAFAVARTLRSASRGDKKLLRL